MNEFRKFRRLHCILVSIAFLATLTVSSVFGQAGASTISGTITNTQNEVVPGATVTLIDVAKNTKRTVVSNDNGSYVFNLIPPGQYKLEVEAKGFKKAVTGEVSALVDKITSLPIALEIGDVTAVVNVDTAGLESIVNTQDASLGNNFIAQQILQLPLEGRNVANLLSLQPAVTPGGYVAGGRSDQANITLDGVDVNNQQEGTAFEPVLRVTPDSVEEFRVTTLNPDASKGRSAGAQISLITKGGSNQFHGNIFYYGRNDALNANEWFNNASNEPRPYWVRHLFGGSLGGPIVKDRAFFFYNFEGMREDREIPVTQIVPLPSLGQGILKFYDSTGVLRSADTAAINSFTATGNVAVVNVNPAAVSYFAAAAARYPSNTNLVGDGINTGGFRFNSPSPTDENTHTARFDWGITRDQNHSLSVRMNIQRDSSIATTAFPDTPAVSRENNPYGFAGTYTWLINSNITNRFSYGLTKLSFSNTGEVDVNAITFRDIYTPYNYTRAFSRDNPTHNITNDTTWLMGNHTVQFGTNIRLIRNHRINDAGKYHSAVANYGYYQNSGSQLTSIVNRYSNATWGTTVGSQSIRSAQSGLAALVGRLNQYTARQQYDHDGNPVNGVPTDREYATEEYDFYVQDSWKVTPTLNLTLGLRYGYSTPVYETRGMETAPNIALDEYFRRRVEYADRGLNYDEPLTIELSGKKNDRPPMYNADTNNFQPRIALAWTPSFDGGIGGFIFGKNGQGVLRGGFGVTNDYYGQQLAVSFDANNTLGFLQQWTTGPNTFNLTSNPATVWDGTNMNIRNFPLVTLPGTVNYPVQQPQDLDMRIESSIDRGIRAPINYTYNVTYGREFAGKIYFEASFIGRNARKLLATRDVMSPNNLRDPISGMTYYEAATIIAQHVYAGGSAATVPVVPFFENMWPQLDPDFYGSNSEMFADWVGPSTDWTFGQLVFDSFAPSVLFYQSQYGALSSFGSIANSDYYGATFSVRQRLSNLTWDFNYTYSHSKDDTSGLQTSTAYGSAFILNPIRQSDNYSWSDFDMRHNINFNAIWQLPFGRGRAFMSDANGFVEAVLGGWQLSSIFRYNSGQPHGTNNKIFDNSGWATNWNLKSAMVQTAPVQTGVYFNGEDGLPTMFADATAAYRSFRSPYPGETGDRNLLRFPSFWNLDMGLQKSFNMPWKENHKVSFRWDVFNVTNNVVFTGNSNTAMGFQPQSGNAPAGYGQFTGTRTEARVMQWAIRYDF